MAENERRFGPTFRGRPRFLGPEEEEEAAGGAGATPEGGLVASLFLLPGGRPRRRFTGCFSCGDAASER